MQLENNNSPIEEIEFGIVIEVKESLPVNAQLPIEVTEFGIVEFPQPTTNVFELVSIIALQLSLESYIGLFGSTVIEVKELHL